MRKTIMENTTKPRLEWTWVFHAEPFAPRVAMPERYECVCEVKSTDPYEVFGLTNVHCIDDSLHWTDNRDVSVLAEPCRSTSVGDLFVTSEGRAWVVENCGFAAFDVCPRALIPSWLLLMQELLHGGGQLPSSVEMPMKRARLSDA